VYHLSSARRAAERGGGETTANETRPACRRDITDPDAHLDHIVALKRSDPGEISVDTCRRLLTRDWPPRPRAGDPLPRRRRGAAATGGRWRPPREKSFVDSEKKIYCAEQIPVAPRNLNHVVHKKTSSRAD
jgi:hypothetical protein